MHLQLIRLVSSPYRVGLPSSSSRPLRRYFASAVAVGLVVIVCGLLWSRTSVRPLSEFDQTFYIGIAHDLRSTGRFTDGFVFAPEDAPQLRPQGMRFAPLYPGLVVVA